MLLFSVSDMYVEVRYTFDFCPSLLTQTNQKSRLARFLKVSLFNFFSFDLILCAVVLHL